MAWIAVHDSIDGPKLRELYKTIGCSKFEAAGMLMFLWQWGVHNADETGHLISADRGDVERYLHSVSTGCSADEGKILDALIRTGWIDEKEDGLYLHDWGSWQRDYYRRKERRLKDALRKRDIRREETEAEEKPQEKQEAEKKESEKKEPEKKEPEKKKPGRDYPEDFTRFWEVYPRRDRKAEAYECFMARVNQGTSPEDMIRAAEAYALKCRKDHTEQRFIQQAKTFLGVHLNFMDYVPKEAPPVKEGGNPFERYAEG